MIRYKVVLLLMFLLSSLGLTAQKKQIMQAQDNIKAGKDLDKAEKSMMLLLNDSVNRRNHKIWLTLIAAQTAQYEQGNEKLYVRQEYDTAALFNTTKRIFTSMEQYDSLESVPDRKGRVVYKSRSRHAEYLNTIRPNLFNGGVYWMNKRDYRQALSYFRTYIDCANLPMFSSYDYLQTDSLIPRAAYWSLICGHRMNDDEVVMENQELALQYKDMQAYTLQYLAEIYLHRQDTLNYVETLRRGFGKFPTYPFFFPRLIEYYENIDQQDSAAVIADKALQADSTDTLFRFAKSTILLNTGKYDECIAICKQLLKEEQPLPDAYYNMGLSYFNQAVELERKKQKYRSKRKHIIQLYELGLPYMEEFRRLAPEEKQKWIVPLYTMYLNLNKGKEFDEIQKLRNEYRKNIGKAANRGIE